jgi:diadenosine tetraphosphate (Ap4A) HIT family hydrolase
MASAEESKKPCGICAIIARARNNEFSDLVAELPRSWVILGDAQLYRGYCFILAKRHVSAPFLMPRGEAHELHDELIAVARAINAVTAPLKLNYECLGNQEPHVHWHIFPRFENDAMRLQPVWVRPEVERKVPLAEGDRSALIDRLRIELARLLPTARW